MEKELTNEDLQKVKTKSLDNKNGLFRHCMNKIKLNHSIGQKLRTALITAGVLTDKNCYAEVLGQFYQATKVLERRLHERKRFSTIVKKVVDLKPEYNFTKGYEADLEALLGKSWRQRIIAVTADPTADYVLLLENASDAELVAGAFILWGPMIVGGGAALYPRISRNFGKEATNVFQSVIGSRRAQRKRDFMVMFDSIASVDENERLFYEIVEAAGKFMEMNNKILLSVQQRPWWMYYVWAGTAIATALWVSFSHFKSK